MSVDAPFGALAVVYRRVDGHIEYLVLHRSVHGPAYDGDWAWGPPGGSRESGETIDTCARRELHEETGLELTLHRAPHPDEDWAVYLAEAPAETHITLSEEHDRWLWLPAERALAMTSPQIIVAELESAIRDLGDEPSPPIAHIRQDTP